MEAVKKSKLAATCSEGCHEGQEPSLKTDEVDSVTGDVEEELVSEEDDADTGTDSSCVDSDMEVEVEFEARPIEEQDFHGIRRLLQQVFLKGQVDLSSLADIIVAQGSYLGSTVKVRTESDSQEDDALTNTGGGVATSEGVASSEGMVTSAREQVDEEDVCEVLGVTSIVSLDQSACSKQVKDHLLVHCEEDGDRQKFVEMLQKNICLLVKERFLNIPVDIVPLLMRSLLKEWEACGSGACDYVITVARSHVVLVPATGRKRRSCSGNWQKEDLVFDFQEDQFFFEAAELVFSYPVSEECDQVFGGTWSLDDEALKPFRTVMILTHAKVETALALLEKALHG